MYFIYRKIVPTFFLISILSNCSNHIFKELKIINHNFTEEYFNINFSSPVSKQKFIESFTFLEDEITQEGTYLFKNNSVSFFPVNGINKNHTYKIIIANSLEDDKGNSLIETYSYSFSTKTESITPKIKTFIPDENNLYITFNSPIDHISFKKCFSITPSLSYIDIWSEDFNSVQITFLESKKNNTYYFYRITEELLNIYNNALLNDFNYVEKYKIDNTPPAYNVFAKTEKHEQELFTNIENTNIPLESTIEIHFTNSINKTNFSSNIIFTPNIDFKIIDNFDEPNIIKINFTNKPLYNSSYKLSILDKATDINQNAIPQSEYLINFNNEKDKTIDYICGQMFIDSQTIDICNESLYKDITFPANIFPTAKIDIEQPEILLIFLFSISKQSKKINQISFIENLSFSSTNNCVSLQANEIKTFSKEEALLDPDSRIQNLILSTNENQNFSIAYIKAKVLNEDSSGLFKIHIPQNIKDDLGNKLEKDYIFIFNKN